MKRSSIGSSIVFAAIVLLLCLQPLTVRAQEAPVSFDSHDDQRGTIFFIDRELRAELGLFNEYRDFERAKLFRVSSSAYRLEIFLEVKGVPEQISKAMDSAEVAALRNEVREKLMMERSLHDEHQSGRTHFLWTTAIASIAYYGPAVTLALSAEETEEAATTYLLSAGAGFFIPYLLTQNAVMTDGMAAGARVGCVLGIVHAGQIFGSIDFLDRASEDEMRTFLGISSLASLAEMGAGIAAAKQFELTEGRMNMIGAGGLLGSFGGHLWGHVILGEELTPSEIGLASIAGSIAGMVTANQLALNTNYTNGDAKTFMMAGVAGAALAAGLLDASEVEFGSKLFSGVMASAGFVSCLAAHRWLEQKDVPDGHGNYIVAGTLGGAFLGTMVSNASSRNSGPEVLATGVGAVLGFVLVAATITSSPQKGLRNADDLGTMEFNFDPGGAALALTGARLNSDRAPGMRINVPIASFSLKL